jgi:hypothetical protein
LNVLLARSVALALVALAAAGEPAEPPLREEAVVRRFVAGASSRELIAWIRSRPVDFDLSPEMLDELRLAGLPEDVVRAMVERQAELRPPPAAAEPAVEARVLLRVRLHDGPDDPSAVLRVPAAIDAGTAERLQLAAGVERFTDVALVLACRTAEHVPDQWRSASPLGRDFVSMPRHELLAFVAAGPPGAEPPAGPALRFELPATLEAWITPGTAHDLLLGVALEAGGRFLLVAADTLEGVIVEQQAERRAELRTRARTIHVRWLESPTATGATSPG